MKAVLEKFEKDLDKCSRCGLCQSVCPVYRVMKTESAVSRGKFLQLLGVIKGHLTLSKKIINNLDICLNCGACKDFCPSDIDACEIFSCAYNDFSDKKPFLKILTSLWMFKFKLLFLKPFLYRLRKKTRSESGSVLFFKGCLSKNNPFGIKDGNFVCCGIPFFTKGRRDIYEKLKKTNIERAKNAEIILFDCATCLDTFKKYNTGKKLILISDLLSDKGAPKLKRHFKVMYHHPCHFNSAGIKKEKIESFLTSIKNLEFVNTESSCCGFSGDFFIRHPLLSRQINKKCRENYIKQDADVILTSCPTCLWGLIFAGTGKKVEKLDDFLAKNLK